MEHTGLLQGCQSASLLKDGPYFGPQSTLRDCDSRCLGLVKVKPRNANPIKSLPIPARFVAKSAPRLKNLLQPKACLLPPRWRAWPDWHDAVRSDQRHRELHSTVTPRRASGFRSCPMQSACRHGETIGSQYPNRCQFGRYQGHGCPPKRQNQALAHHAGSAPKPESLYLAP